MKKFVKPDVLSTLKLGSAVLRLDTGKTNNLITVREVYVVFEAKRSLHGSDAPTQSKSTLVNFRIECRGILQRIIVKFQDRNPLKYPLTKAISALDPNFVWCNPSESTKRFNGLCDEMIDALFTAILKHEVRRSPFNFV